MSEVIFDWTKVDLKDLDDKGLKTMCELLKMRAAKVRELTAEVERLQLENSELEKLRREEQLSRHAAQDICERLKGEAERLVTASERLGTALAMGQREDIIDANIELREEIVRWNAFVKGEE